MGWIGAIVAGRGEVECELGPFVLHGKCFFETNIRFEISVTICIENDDGSMFISASEMPDHRAFEI